MIDEKKLIKELDAWWETLSPGTDARDSIICDVIESVIEKINNAEKVGEWIPVSERLPEKKGEYLFTTNSYSGVTIEIYIFDPENNWDVEFAKTGMDLMAWMPLPEPYKEEGEFVKEVRNENDDNSVCMLRS